MKSIDIKATFLSFTAPTLTNFSLFGLGSFSNASKSITSSVFQPLLFLLDPNCSFRSLWPRKHLAKLEFINY